MGLLHLLFFLAVSIHEAAWVLARRNICDNQLSITGGHEVSIMEVPFMVAITNEHSAYQDDYIVYCAGTIIHNRFILTAASCFEEVDATNKTVRMATQSLVMDNGINNYVEGMFCHQDYDKETLINDICLLKLEIGVPFGWLVKAALPDKDFVLEEGTLVNVTGWGASSRYLDINNDLRQVTVPVLSQECCVDAYDVFIDKEICAGAWRRDFCKGDTGGPLTINNMQVGIISGSGECGKHPGYYTRVSSYLDWIESTIKNNL